MFQVVSNRWEITGTHRQRSEELLELSSKKKAYEHGN